MFQSLAGKRVLVTGASSGIGAATAGLFAECGAVVGLHYNTGRDAAVSLHEKIRSAGGTSFLLQADLLDRTACSSLVGEFTRLAGGIDILVNSAGAFTGNTPFQKLGLDAWDRAIGLNLTAPFIISRAAFTHMQEHGGGKIISISSIAAKYGGSESSIHYGAAKAGLEAVTKTLARAGAQHNILVNAVQPGVIDTPAHKKIGRMSLDERLKSIPLRRAGTPLDVAQMCVFLASEAGDYITGQIYSVSGGD
ncbi:MAG TPA: SDR family NAD(P)-dependent oxidoreductase [Methanoregula sp.]|nr:SDR family NAD(P)-dependent oxidoreductase [Methanoregula sp.]